MSPAAAPDSLIGFTLSDRYRIVRQIGKGGMGVVYEAEHVELGKRVAIKLVLEKYADDSEALKRFRREALAASSIGNPHIIDVIDIGLAPDGRPFVVMELLSGAPLSKVLEASGTMPAWRAVPIMRQVLRAVGAAHAKGIVHRDLKPDNIFLLDHEDNHDFIKLLDFGISKIMSDSTPGQIPTRLTTTGVVMGTPLYMAPEQAMGAVIDHQVDIYACGVIMYELLSGRPPFDAPTYPVLIAQLLTAEPPMLSTLMPGLPGSIVAAVHRALEKDPTKRWATADQFAAALGRERTPSQIELAGTMDSAKSLGMAATQATPSGGSIRTPVAAVTAMPTTKKDARGGRPSAIVIAGIGAGLAIAIGGGVYLASRGHDTPTPPTTTPTTAVATPATPTNPGATVTATAITPPPTAGSGSGSATVTAPTTGTLDTESKPPGAAITVDGVDAGSSPMKLVLPLGKHHVKFALAGYGAFESDVVIEGGKTLEMLVPLAATTPPARGAQVGGASVATSPPPGKSSTHPGGKPTGPVTSPGNPGTLVHTPTPPVPQYTPPMTHDQMHDAVKPPLPNGDVKPNPYGQ